MSSTFAPARRAGLACRWLLGLAVLAATIALAAPTTLTLKITATTTGVDIRAEGIIRYSVDYAARTMVIPFATLEEMSRPPKGLEVQLRADGLLLAFARPFTVTISPDGHVLTVTGGLPSVPEVTSSASTQLTVNAETSLVMYRLSYGDPSTLAGLITRLYTVKVEVDERQRALLVVMTNADKPFFDALVRELDAPRPQVAFEAEILEINTNLTQSLGIRYDSLFTLSFVEQGPNPLNLGSFVRSPININLGISLLKETGAARVLARPRITTLDGVEARLNATQTVSQLIPGQSGAQNVQTTTTGINMRLLPRVNPEGTVESSLSITVSIPAGQTSGGQQQFSTREATTTVRVRNGEPIAIGGLYENREENGVSAVPGLSEIPVLGELFKSTRTVSRTTDLVIVVTPFIVGLPVPSVPQPPATRPTGEP